MFCNFVLGFFFLWKTQTVSAQQASQTIVSPLMIAEGGSFTVRCDASRGGVPTNFQTISRLNLVWTPGTVAPITLARYRTFISPYNNSYPPQTSPARNWTFNFSGGQQGTSERLNNRNTMKIEMVVYDAKCADAGLYFCNATYITPNDDEITVYQYQNVTSIIQAVPLSLTLFPQYEEGLGPYESVNPAGSNVTLTCRVNGPKALTFTWRYGKPSSDVNSFTSYPVQNDILVYEPFQISSGTTCIQYRHTSTLKFQTEDMYDGYMYVCVATENNRDTIVGNITIYIKLATPAPAPDEDTSDNKNNVKVLYYILPVVFVVGVGVVVLAVYFRKGCPNRVMNKPSEPKSTTPTTIRTLPTPPDNDGYAQVSDASGGYDQLGETAGLDPPYGATDPTSAREPKVQSETHHYSSIDDPHYTNDSVDSHHTNGLQQNQTIHYNNLPQNSQLALNQDRQNNVIPTMELNEYINVYDTPEETAYNDTVNTYLTPKFDS
ncbi:uncharacterized protein LOC131944639 [Physella acuta]|uniref:uncharacterized protein LOC131944639 n=1 Tax=Physella acuta TaxID=109671 RepID=UPI0027DBD91A|nr:uncharacterized protein LOC131944639 [Physella acuta]